MFARTRPLLAALAVGLLAGTSSHAIKLLQPGPQTLEGVLVHSTSGNPSGCIIPARPGLGIAPRPAVMAYGLLLSPGSKSEQYLAIEVPVGNRDVAQYLMQNSVRRQPKGSRYEGSRTVSVHGNLEGSYKTGFTFFVAQVPGSPSGPDYSDARTVRETLKRWRFMAADADSTGQASVAMTRLEKAGLLEEMVKAALEISRQE